MDDSTPPTAIDAEIWDLRLSTLHRHDSRPGSWCILVGRIDGTRCDYHLSYDPHNPNPNHRTIWRRDWITDAYSNSAALAIICERTNG